MEDSRLVYCCNCENIMPITNARQVFRTGFYRIKYPLCWCTDCAQMGAYAELAAAGIIERDKPEVMNPEEMNENK